MSAVGTITRIAGTVVTRTAQVVLHPVGTTKYAAGVARGVAGAVLPIGQEEPPTDRGDVDVAAAAEPVVTTPDPEAAAGRPPIPVAAPPEAVTTEPSAPTRNAAHGGPGADSVDDWREELDDGPDVETPVGTTGASRGTNPDTGDTDLQQPGTAPLMDPSLTKAVRAESETLQKAADPTKE
ncbi:hypothetical protein [Nocardioides panacisoli]|uniref:Uncharacterized protein n=1 Tax=Nocardioides panacisoli TaxID=627624 RepID=A0ABP7IIK9_9ACTN